MGARSLRQWVLRPSIDRAEIEARRDGVADLNHEVITRTELEKELQPVLDIERLLARITLGSATARDIAGLGKSLACLPAIRTRIAGRPSERMREIHERMDELPDIRERIEAGLSDEAARPPSSTAERSARDFMRSSMSCAPCAQTAGAISPGWRHASGSEPVFSRLRCVSTTCLASTSKSRKRTWRLSLMITTGNRRWSMQSASQHRS